MSSSILTKGEAADLRPFAWRTVAPGAAQDRRHAVPDSRFNGAAGRHPLEARIAELEKALEERPAAAREEGFREGLARGRDEAERELRTAIERLAQSIAGLNEFRQRLRHQTESEAVRLSIAIARRVLRRELTVDPGAIEGLLRSALERLPSQENCRVRIHPDHVSVLQASVDRLGITARVEIVSDPAQELGAALFEMPRGNLDASIDSQLREIERGLADRVEKLR